MNEWVRLVRSAGHHSFWVDQKCFEEGRKDFRRWPKTPKKVPTRRGLSCGRKAIATAPQSAVTSADSDLFRSYNWYLIKFESIPFDCWWLLSQTQRQSLRSGRKRRKSTLTLSFKESSLNSGRYCNCIWFHAVGFNWCPTIRMNWRWRGERADAAEELRTRKQPPNCFTVRGRCHLLRSVLPLQLATSFPALELVTSVTSSDSSGSSGPSGFSGPSGSPSFPWFVRCFHLNQRLAHNISFSFVINRLNRSNCF